MTIHVFGPETMPNLLRCEIRDEGTLSLTSAPVLICSQVSNGFTRFSLLIDAPLDRRRLMDLLFAVAPYKAHGPDRFSRLLDNWALMERAKASSASERLMLEHAKHLKFSWHEFDRHRPAFIEVMQDAAGARRLLPVINWFRGDGGKRQWDFAPPDQETQETIGDVWPGVVQERLDTLAGLVTIPYYLPELRRNWRAWLPLEKRGKSNYIGPASVPVLALMHRRSLLNCALIQRVEAYVSESTR